MRRLVKRKPKPPKKTRTEVYMTNLRYLGDEPVYPEGHVLTVREKSFSYSWYNYMKTQDEARQYALDWCEKNDQELIKVIERIPPKFFPQTAGWILRLADMGVKLDESVTFAKNLIRSSKEYVSDEPASDEANTENVIEISTKTGNVKNKYDFYVGELEVVIDSGDWEHNVYQALQGNNFPVSMVNDLKSHYKPLLEEFKLAVSGSNPDVKEGYSNWKKADIKKAAEWLDGAIEDMTRYGQTKRKTRVVKKKKTPNVDKKIANFVVQQNSAEYKLVSLNPRDVLGCSEILLFNTKYRTLILLKAKEGGIDIKGKSFHNVDEEASRQTGTGHKPEKAITEVMLGGKATVNDWMKKKANPEKKAKVSSDSNTIILRIFK